MIEHSFQHGRLLLRVQVVPRASRSEVVGEHNGALRVRIAAPPVDGAANDELVRVLAKKFGVARQDVTLVSGHNSRHKQVQIESLNDEVVSLISQLETDSKGSTLRVKGT